MQISGTGITAFTCKTLPGFKPLTKLAIKWRQLDSGNWVATDRGSGADTYESKISIYGVESVIDNFISQIYSGRTTGNNQITLSSFATNETIFGENVDHSGSISATILDMPQKQQGSWKGFGLSEILVRAITPSFTGSSSWPSLRYLEPRSEMDADYTITKYDSYSAAMTYLDHRSDAGIFDGTFILKNADLKSARNYIRTQRSGDFTLSNTFGVAKPFGPRSAFAYPGAVKLISWTDLGEYGLLYRRLRLRFAEVV